MTSHGMFARRIHLDTHRADPRRFRGTKQQDANDNDLGVVSAAQQRASNVVQVELSSEPHDTADAQYAESLANLRTRKPVQQFSGDFHAEQVAAAKDYYANIRTNVSFIVYVRLEKAH